MNGVVACASSKRHPEDSGCCAVAKDVRGQRLLSEGDDEQQCVAAAAAAAGGGRGFLKGTDLVEEHQEGKEDATKISTSGIPSGAAQRTAAGAQSPRMAAAAVTVAAGGGGGHEGYGPCRGGQGGRGGHHKDLS